MPDARELARERFGREHPNVLLQTFAIQNLSRELLQRAFLSLPIDPRDWGVLSVLRVRPADTYPRSPRSSAWRRRRSSTIARLSRRRLVRKRRNPDDGRSYLLEVSAPGLALIERVGPSFRDAPAPQRATRRGREDVLDAQAVLTEALRRALADTSNSQ